MTLAMLVAFIELQQQPPRYKLNELLQGVGEGKYTFQKIEGCSDTHLHKLMLILTTPLFDMCQPVMSWPSSHQGTGSLLGSLTSAPNQDLIPFIYPLAPT